METEEHSDFQNGPQLASNCCKNFSQIIVIEESYNVNDSSFEPITKPHFETLGIKENLENSSSLIELNLLVDTRPPPLYETLPIPSYILFNVLLI